MVVAEALLQIGLQLGLDLSTAYFGVLVSLSSPTVESIVESFVLSARFQSELRTDLEQSAPRSQYKILMLGFFNWLQPENFVQIC